MRRYRSTANVWRTAPKQRSENCACTAPEKIRLFGALGALANIHSSSLSVSTVNHTIGVRQRGALAMLRTAQE